jgi:hypothetical protein
MRSLKTLVRVSLVLMVAALVLFAFVAPSFAQGPTPTPSKIGVPKPAAPKEAKSVAGTADWDKMAADLAKGIGFTNFVYEAWELPAKSTWDETFKYYNDQLKATGWTGDGITKDFTGGKVGVWLNTDGKTGLVIIFLTSPDGTKPAYDLAVFGLTTPVPVLPKDATQITQNAAVEASVKQLAVAAGFGDYVSEVYTLPATFKWDDLRAYYDDQMTQAGWKAKGTVSDIDATTKLGMWIDSNTQTGMLLLYIAGTSSADPAVSVAIFGLSTTSTTPATSASTTPAAQPTVAPTQAAPAANLSPAATDKYPFPPGKAGWVVKSFIGDELNYTFAGKLYKIPGNGEVFIVMDPGKYTFSINIPGKGEATGEVELKADALDGQTWQLGQ